MRAPNLRLTCVRSTRRISVAHYLALAFERTATFRVEASSLEEAERLWDAEGPECGEGIYVTWESVVRPIPDYCAKHGYPLDDGCGGRQECAKCAQEAQ